MPGVHPPAKRILLPADPHFKVALPIESKPIGISFTLITGLLLQGNMGAEGGGGGDGGLVVVFILSSSFLLQDAKMRAMKNERIIPFLNRHFILINF